MDETTEKIIETLEQVAEDARAAFGAMTAGQLNWKPAEKGWSIAQCLDHLITTHNLYFPLFERLAAGRAEPNFWEKMSPMSGFFGRFLIRSLDPENQKKMKTTAKAQPSTSDISGDIVNRFCSHQSEMVEHIRRLPSGPAARGTIITSPLFRLVTYRLDDCLTIIEVHCKRHLGQAERVAASEGFPKAVAEAAP